MQVETTVPQFVPFLDDSSEPQFKCTKIELNKPNELESTEVEVIE